jgi:hypothetical protein
MGVGRRADSLVVAIVLGPRSTPVTTLPVTTGLTRPATFGLMVGMREGTLIVGARMIACAYATSTPRAFSRSATPTDEAQAPALVRLSNLRFMNAGA